jgi:CheY-like chemotaxis protein
MTTPTHDVLVVEDDETFRDAVCEALREQRMSCTRCEDGQDALDLLRAGASPCLVLLDLEMPFVDGMSFRRRQLGDPKLADIPVVLVTGHRRKEGEARRLGISVCLKKPILPSRLVEVVEQNCAHASRPRSASVG